MNLDEEAWPRFISARKNIRKPWPRSLPPASSIPRYLRRQILVHMGRKTEGKKELEAAVTRDNERRAAREKQVETGTVPSPEVLLDPQ